jgi:tetratricopeptide (TPR) repeat protein
LRTLPGIGPSRRQEAITVAETFPEDSSALDARAWELVKLPGGEITGYRQALRFSEEASQLEPKNGILLRTLGVAYYRAGEYEKALDTLLRSDAINKTQHPRSRVANLAFLAMTHQQLGHSKEAEAVLELVRERIKDLSSAQAVQAQVFLREAEELLAKPKPPSSK